VSAYLGPPPGGTVQQPRLRVSLGGVALPRPIEATVTQTNMWTASRWSVSAALQDADAMNAAWFASQADIRVEIDVSVDGGQNFLSLLSGITDSIEIAPDYNSVVMQGRDLAALLIDNKTADAYQNQTASEIATILAQRAGLGTSHIVATTTPVGQYYGSNHVKMNMGDLSHAVTQWDLLIWLAQQEGFDVFVQGQDLYFQPAQSSGGPAWQVIWQRVGGVATSNVLNLNMSRSLTLAKGVKVTVKSWNSTTRKMVTAIATSPAPGKVSGEPQSYVFYKPNLDPAAAQSYATQQLASITRHERVITFECAGELALTPRSTLQLSGTGTSFDQAYYPDEIVRSISFDGAFSQQVTAKNHSASEQVALASGSYGQSEGLNY
jgi:phage protein D